MLSGVVLNVGSVGGALSDGGLPRVTPMIWETTGCRVDCVRVRGGGGVGRGSGN